MTTTKLARFDNVEVRVERFEEATLDPNAFGLVTCAQVFHWLDPPTRLERIARCLYAHGSAAIIGNVQVTPDDDRPFFERVQDVYLAIAPDLAHQGEFRKPDDMPPHEMANSELFYDLEQREHPWSWTLGTEAYLGLMSTHSPHAALDAETRARLLDAIGELIEAEFGGNVTEHYVAMVSLSRRS